MQGNCFGKKHKARRAVLWARRKMAREKRKIRERREGLSLLLGKQVLFERLPREEATLHEENECVLQEDRRDHRQPGKDFCTQAWPGWSRTMHAVVVDTSWPPKKTKDQILICLCPIGWSDTVEDPETLKWVCLNFLSSWHVQYSFRIEFDWALENCVIFTAHLSLWLRFISTRVLGWGNSPVRRLLQVKLKMLSGTAALPEREADGVKCCLEGRIGSVCWMEAVGWGERRIWAYLKFWPKKTGKNLKTSTYLRYSPSIRYYSKLLTNSSFYPYNTPMTIIITPISRWGPQGSKSWSDLPKVIAEMEQRQDFNPGSRGSQSGLYISTTIR